MKITLVTDDAHISRHYLETLALLYLPGEKFGEAARDACNRSSSASLDLTFSRSGAALYAGAVLEIDGKTYRKTAKGAVSDYALFAEAAIPCDSASNAEKAAEKARSDAVPHAAAVKCFCASLILSLFKAHFGYFPPWGTLTGIRPARFALDLLLRDFSRQTASEILTRYYCAAPEKAALALETAAFDRRVMQNERAVLSEKRSCAAYSLYLSIPFCPTRCRYCSFVSYATPELKQLIPAYLEALADEVKLLCETARAYRMTLRSIYIGGGTPTMLDAASLEKLLSVVVSCANPDKDTEFTCEAGRPDTLDAEKLHVLKRGGVRRICVNTQSTNDEVLSSVGRCHTFRDYCRAYEAARAAGFTVNTDLIAGLPGESAESFCKSVDMVLALRPQNLTIHAFSLKKSSDYTVSGMLLDPKDTGIAAMLSYASRTVCEAGYFPYYLYRQKNTGGNFENVGYTVSAEDACRYNVYMMEGLHTVLAAGAGAATKLVADGGCIEKLYNPKYPYEYLRAGNDMLKRTEHVARFFETNLTRSAVRQYF